MRIVGREDDVVVTDQIDDHRQLFFMFGGDPALALEILTRFKFARRRESAFFHGVVHAVQQKRNPTAVTLEKSQFQFRMPLAHAAADGVGHGNHIL